MGGGRGWGEPVTEWARGGKGKVLLGAHDRREGGGAGGGRLERKTGGGACRGLAGLAQWWGSNVSD